MYLRKGIYCCQLSRHQMPPLFLILCLNKI
uniref:Uncharacterized protein n=1 Tax=Setaria italica TaxID=4555 RepID=K3ZG01_SETIT